MKKQIASTTRTSRYALTAGALAAVLALSAYANRALARRAEKDNPPEGDFIEIKDVRLHYVARGAGKALVLLHGNGSMIQDFESSGLIRMAAQTYRVIAFDRPGYGHSERPRGKKWTPEAQAELIHAALLQLGVEQAIVLGHSWGASVAVALGVKFPGMVSGLVLASGYFYPTPRADAAFQAGLGIPVLGDVMLYTVAPFLSRLLWPAMVRKIFAPPLLPENLTVSPAK